MGYVQILGSCFACGRRFTFNPHRVPSFRDPKSGEREPICSTCIVLVNRSRKARGLEEFVVHPDAYDAIPEEQF